MSSVSRGWRAAWCDPDLFENTYVREIIRGPFPSPKITCLLPFFKCCQNHCKEQFLSPHVKKNQGLTNKFQMTKENEDLLEAVRNNYGLSIGHGIPDPWISPPYCGMSHSHNDDMNDFLKKFIFHILENKRNNHPCLCCEKRYLFGCPDRNEAELRNLKNILNCPCTDCHGKNEKPTPECGENCKCIKTIKNWVLDNAHLLKNKNINEPEKDETVSVISNKSNQKKFLNKKVEAKETNDIYSCTCPPNEGFNLKTPTYKTSTSESKCKKVYHVGYQYTPQPSKMNVSSSKESPDETSESDLKKTFSRNSSDSFCKGCQCFMRCSSCGGQDSRSFCTQICSSAQCLASYNPSYQISSNTPISAPTYDNSTPPTREKKKKDRSSDKKKKKEKKKKEKYENSDSQSKSQDSQLEDSTSCFLRRSSILKNSGTKTSNDTTETSNSRIIHSRSFSLPINHLKYITDQKLRRYLQRKELSKNSMSTSQYPSLQSATPISSTFKTLCEGESLSLIALQKCRPFRYYRRDTGDSSCDDTIRDWHYRPSTRKFNFGAQTSLSIINEIDSPKNKMPTNIKFFKDVESDESGICLPLRTYDRTYRENRIRRRLITNRKRRKKLLTRRNWYTLQPKVPERAHKVVQVSENSEDSVVRSRSTPYEKRVSFDFDVAGSKIFTLPSGWQLLEDQTSSETVCRKLNGRRILSSNRRGNLENVLDKISYNSGTSWSSNTLKNMVDDLSMERKPPRYKLFDAGIQTSSKNH